MNLRMRSGLIPLEVTFATQPLSTPIRVFQEDAYLSLDYEKQSGEIYRREAGKITRDKVPIEREEPLKQQLVSFIECSSTGREPRVSGFQATAALELAVEISKRIESSG